MKDIKSIPISLLQHHPENPRKDLGDLSELAESIKANGVMQNLTVVAAEDGKFLVVIGNRRMEAAKMAGMEELPCFVSDMDHRTQISTMLMENMQRQDLTVYEQAQGFQMMMDLGFTAKDISEKTGFSEKTVKDRIKFTKFNQKNFQDAVAKGATLLDMLEISKLKSKTDQNEVMAATGTNNFRQILLSKLSDQRYKEGCEKLEQIIREFEIPKIPENLSAYSNGITWTSHKATSEDSDDKIRKVIKKALKEYPGADLMYRFTKIWNKDEAEMTILKREQKKDPSELSDEEKAQKEKRKEEQRRSRYTRKLWAEAYNLRLDFVKNYTITVNGTGMNNIAKLIVRYSLGQKQKYGRDTLPENQHWKGRYIREALGLKEEEYEDRKSILEAMEGKDIPMIRAAIAWIMGGGVFDCDTPESGFYTEWDGSYNGDAYTGTMLKERYEFLKEIGYEMSDMEIQLMDGTHPCYRGEVST